METLERLGDDQAPLGRVDIDLSPSQMIGKGGHLIVFGNEFVEITDGLPDFIVGIVLRQFDRHRFLAFEDRIKDCRDLVDILLVDLDHLLFLQAAGLTSNRHTRSPEHQQSTSFTANFFPENSNSRPLMNPSS